jgi:hypothetical protein
MFIAQASFGQFIETIQTGRPSQAIGAFSVDKSTIQFQHGVDYYSLAITTNPTHSFVINNVIRYRILETIELSALIEYELSKPNWTLITLQKPA